MSDYIYDSSLIKCVDVWPNEVTVYGFLCFVWSFFFSYNLLWLCVVWYVVRPRKDEQNTSVLFMQTRISLMSAFLKAVEPISTKLMYRISSISTPGVLLFFSPKSKIKHVKLCRIAALFEGALLFFTSSQLVKYYY